jgi:nitrite reductase (NO-forming)/hydroxylamine reductase
MRLIQCGVFVLCLLLAGCQQPPGPSPGNKTPKPVATGSSQASPGMDVFKSKGCTACHSLDGSKRVGPTFQGLFGKEEVVLVDGKEQTIKVDEEYLKRAITDPDAEIVKGYVKGQMPPMELTDEEVAALVDLIKDPEAAASSGSASSGEAPEVTPEEMKVAADIYFNRCSGCHGTLRVGATGPSLLPDKRTIELGTEGIKTMLHNGSPKGMPAWGKDGILTDDEIDLMARFVQQPPPPAPEMSLEQMKETWKVLVKPADRPTKPMHKRNWQNFVGVILRDAGQVAVYDGDTKEMLKVLDTGFAVHILRSSATGRYLISIGRDGKVTLIDLWTEEPQIVAEVRAAYEARSVDASKYHGKLGDFRDKYLVVGGYWPPHLVFLDGQTLEPLKIVSTSGYTVDTNEFLREARVAAIVASHTSPEFVCNIKETGQVWLVDYSDLENLTIRSIAADRFLHDGGWDSTKRYVLMAANARHKIAVVDTLEKKQIALVEVGDTPHPGRGANIDHPEHGPMWVTGHLGDNTLQAIGTDPKGHPKQAWKVVAKAEMPGDGGGNLFVKSHPKSKWLWADRALHPTLKNKIYVFDKVTMKLEKELTLPESYPGRAVHMEYNKAGDEVWVSAWSEKGTKSGVLIYDDKTLELKKEITGDYLITPTGKFNVYNTTHDLY